MSKPKLFIGSSKKNIAVARLVANRLEADGCADVTVWDEGVFSLGQGFLEKLLAVLDQFDFAVLIWAADDLTGSQGDSKASPRDNVVFECGLFMGAVGRERVFIVCDQSIALKIPSDLAGITLANYDGSRIGGDDAEAAVRTACDRIAREIERPRYPTIVGEWRSRYALSAEPGHPEVIEDVEIKAARGGVSIVSKNNPANDFYIAYGRILNENQIQGHWQAKLGSGEARGLFMLTMSPRGLVMYGYATTPSETNATGFGTWVLAKNDGVDETTMEGRLRWGQETLKSLTLALPPPESGP